MLRLERRGPIRQERWTSDRRVRHGRGDISTQYTEANGAGVAAIPSVEVDYGVMDRLQTDVQAPLQLVHVNGVGTNVGISDMHMGVEYRFIEPDDARWTPGVAFAPAIVLPSGSQQRGLGAGRVQGFRPVWLSKDFDEWSVFGGGGYNINPGPMHLNWWFTGLGVTRDLSDRWTIGTEIFRTTPVVQGNMDGTGFNVGAI